MGKTNSLAHRTAQEIINQEDIRPYDVWHPTRNMSGEDTGLMFALGWELQQAVKAKVAALEPKKIFELIWNSPVQPKFADGLSFEMSNDLKDGLRYVARSCVIQAMEQLVPKPLLAQSAT
jgi:hypothetical protein